MLVVMMTVTMTIAQKTKTPLMKITTMSQIQTNLLVKIGQTWKGKQKKMTKSMKTKKGEVTNLHTDHHTKTGDQKITLYLSLKFLQKINCLISRKNINFLIFLRIFRSPQKSRHGSSHHSSSRNGHHSTSKDKHSSSHSDKRKRDRDSSSGGKHSKSPKKMRSRRQ